MIKKRSEIQKLEINLSGPQGNAFVLMGHARSLAKQLGKDGKAITDEMMDGNYDHLIEVFDREFGEYVDLVRAGDGDEDDQDEADDDEGEDLDNFDMFEDDEEDDDESAEDA